jgi:hypothetical protein
MDLNFFDQPDLVPKPREEVQIEHVNLLPYPDNRRVKVEIKITPFIPSDKPDLAIAVRQPDGTEIASTHVVQTMQSAITLTIHLRRNPEVNLPYTFQFDLLFEEGVVHHSLQQTLTFN